MFFLTVLSKVNFFRGRAGGLFFLCDKVRCAEKFMKIRGAASEPTVPLLKSEPMVSDFA